LAAPQARLVADRRRIAAGVLLNPPPMDAAARSNTQRMAWRAAMAAWLALLLLTVLWEWLFAPLRPGGSWLVLKAVPLLLPLRGLARGSARAMQWALLLVLLYVAEGSARFADPAPVASLARLEIALALLFFIAAIVYLRPMKQARAEKRT
jgi:uncharacterized membrane protein